MKTRLTPLVLLATLAVSAATSFAQSGEQEERIGASFVLALGRAPSAGETELWGKPGRLPVAELIARHQQQLQGAASLQRAAVIKACADAFGREPTAREIDTWSAGNPTYTGLMKQHIQWLGEHATEYRKVMERAYQRVMRRPAYSVEIEYWNAQPTLSFVLLVGCIEDWARRNAPGLMATTGTPTVSVNSGYLTTIRLSPAVAAEARDATGLFPAGEPNLAAAAGRHLVAAGAGTIITSGHIHFVAAGGDNLLPAPGGD